MKRVAATLVLMMAMVAHADEQPDSNSKRLDALFNAPDGPIEIYTEVEKDTTLGDMRSKSNDGYVIRSRDTFILFGVMMGGHELDVQVYQRCPSEMRAAFHACPPGDEVAFHSSTGKAGNHRLTPLGGRKFYVELQVDQPPTAYDLKYTMTLPEKPIFVLNGAD